MELGRVDLDSGEASCLKAAGQRLGVHGDERVIDVPEANHLGVARVGPHKDPTGAKHSAELSEESILGSRRWNVMQHGESRDRRETVGAESRCLFRRR